MLFSHEYILPTKSVEGVGNASRSAATVATFWLSLAKEGVLPLHPLHCRGLACLKRRFMLV
jgi:hypothetical protein